MFVIVSVWMRGWDGVDDVDGSGDDDLLDIFAWLALELEDTILL